MHSLMNRKPLLDAISWSKKSILTAHGLLVEAHMPEDLAVVVDELENAKAHVQKACTMAGEMLQVVPADHEP